jgi:hypothetical protein
MDMKTFASAALIAILSAPAQAQSLQLSGKFGFLSEYELSGRLEAQEIDGKPEYLGPLIIKHVGLCTHDGPNELDGQMRLLMTDATRVSATLSFDGKHCTFRGRMSESGVGELVCLGEALPFNIWSK